MTEIVGDGSTLLKACRRDLKRLKTGLAKAGSTCHLAGVLNDTDCCPCVFNVNSLPSRQRIVNAESVGNKLDKVFVRAHVLSSLDGQLDCRHIPKGNNCDDFIKTKLSVDSEKCKVIEKNTRSQSECKEWFEPRKFRLTASMFGCGVKRRKSIYPTTIVKSITKPCQINGPSCVR